jgi:hypothetical protein
MSSVSIQGNASGTGIFTIASPNSNTNRTLTLPDATGTVLTSASSITASQLPSGTIVQVKWAQQSAGNITVTNSSGGQAALYSQPAGRVYGDLVNVSITPLSASNRLLFLCHAGNSSTTGSTQTGCAWGIVVVKDNTTGYETGDYPWYASGVTGGWAGVTTGYPPDQHYQYTISAGSTSSQTFYLKGFSYSEGNSQSSVFRGSSLIILEVSA